MIAVPELSRHFDRVRYVPKRVGHHAQHSGYDVLFSSCGMHAARSASLVRVAGCLPEWLAWRLWALRPQPSQQSGLEAELAALPWTALGHGRICHFIYGEDTFLFTPLWKRGSNRCIATLHYPPAMLSRRVNPGSLSGLDAVVIVGENQREWLNGVVASEKVHFCPHHVDTDFFCPSMQAMPAVPDRLICVGNLFRDYDSLWTVLRTLRTEYGHEIGLDIVGAQDRVARRFAGERGVVMHRGIDDETLRSLYRSAAIGVLPLTDSTANNALLEMMATGLPVVVSGVGGVRDYVRGSGVVCVPPGDALGLARSAHVLLADSMERARRGTANREHALRELSLSACAKKLAAIYDMVGR